MCVRLFKEVIMLQSVDDYVIWTTLAFANFVDFKQIIQSCESLLATRKCVKMCKKVKISSIHNLKVIRQGDLAFIC